MGMTQVGQSSYTIPASCKGPSAPMGMRPPEPIMETPPQYGGSKMGLTGYSPSSSSGLTGNNYNTGSPTGGTGAASIMSPQPSYSQPAPSYSAPQPVSSSVPAPTPGPAYGYTPAPTYSAPAPSTTSYSGPAYKPPPPPQQYEPYDPQSSPVSKDLGYLSGKGQELLDPNSDYYKELVSQMRGDIGKSTAASKRSAALAGAEQGFGAGASPEMMSMMGDIGEAGRIAEGEAMGDLSLAAPKLGAGMMASTFGPGVGLEGIGEQSSQYGHGAFEAGTQWRSGEAEGARKTDVNTGLVTMGMADERAAREADDINQWNQWEAEFGLREDSAAADFGWDGGGYTGGGGALGASY